MTLLLFLEQLFNGVQFGVTLFLIAAGLTLILGIMDFVFLAHGGQVMIGAYAAASLTSLTGNFFLGILLAIPITFASGYILEYILIRHLYRRDHMDQVLATFGLILFFNELIRIGFGPAALFSDLPPSLSGFVYILPDTPYPMFRVIVIMVGLACALGIHFLVSHTKMGAMVRAGANNEAMTAALGINIRILRRVLFAAGACFAGIAGMMLGPLTAVEPGMGEPLLIRRYRVGARGVCCCGACWPCRYNGACSSALCVAQLYRTGSGRRRWSGIGLDDGLYPHVRHSRDQANRLVPSKVSLIWTC